MPIKDLHNMFMLEAAELLSQSVYRSFRVGHYHKNKRLKWVDTDTIAGVDITVLPSLSGTDAWHFENGFVGNMRSAVASLWSRETDLLARLLWKHDRQLSQGSTSQAT